MNDTTKLSTTGRAFPGNEQVSLERLNGGPGPSHASYQYGRDEDQASHLLDYWRIIRKHLWLIVGISILIPTLVGIYLIRKPDIYESQARVQVDLENANPLLGGMSKNSSVILSGETNDPAYFNTQLQILTGPGLLRRIVKNLDLEHNPDFASDQGANKSMWSQIRTILGFKSKIDSKNSPSDALP